MTPSSLGKQQNEEEDRCSLSRARRLKRDERTEKEFPEYLFLGFGSHCWPLSQAFLSCDRRSWHPEEMASPSRQPPLGGSGLLQGSRARSYGSLVQSSCSPVRERRLEHQLEPGDTLAGLALKYGVTMEQIKRTNRLYTNDSIFLKKTLYIPILTEPRDLFNGLDSEEENDGEEEVRPRKDGAGSHSGKRKNQESGSGRANGEALPPHQETSTPIHDLSASDFLKKLDSQINLSKKAAAQRLRKGESGVPEEGGGLHLSSPRTQQRAVLGPVPLTRTSRTQTLRDQEDEIFKL